MPARIDQSAFASQLAALLARRRLSYRAFADAVGVDHTFVYRVVHGRQKPVLKHLETWADCFGLSGSERELFLDLGHLTRATPRVQALVARLQRR